MADSEAPGQTKGVVKVRRKSKAQLFLERVEMVDSIINNKLIEQRQWKDLALGITANMGGERVQSSGSKSKMADALNKVIDMEDEINRTVDKLISVKCEVVSVLEQLDTPMEYNVLHKRFIQYKTLREIADECGKDYDWVKTVNGRAIASVQRILDKK